MLRLWITLLLVFVGGAHAVLTNFTVDDTSPDIVYGGPTFHCPSSTCPAVLTAENFNGTSTITFGSISFSWAGG
jgi:hypothetical protein